MKVIIMSGISGSGKSTIAQKRFPDAAIVSADHFFTDENGQYNYDVGKISLAHQECWRKFFELVQRKTPLIIVDNTNIEVSDIAPYVMPAQSFGYIVEIHTFLVDPQVAFQRNTHNVPMEVIQKMDYKLRNRLLPPYWIEFKTIW